MYSDPIDPIKEAKKRGIRVFDMDGEGILNGMIVKDEGETFICVEKNLLQNKKNVVIAHELGHYDTDTIQAPAFPRLEHIANKRAREILLPEEALREYVRDGIDEYSALASIFGCSAKMVEMRCREVGY